jgi:hypothetical protein
MAGGIACLILMALQPLSLREHVGGSDVLQASVDVGQWWCGPPGMVLLLSSSCSCFLIHISEGVQDPILS